MSDLQKYIRIGAICLIGLLILGVSHFCVYKCGHRNGFTSGYDYAMSTIQTDTTSVAVDTSSYEKPEPVEVVQAGYVQVKAGTVEYLKRRIAQLEAQQASSAPLPPAGNVSPVDSLPVEVSLPVEKKVYRDSTYECQVSGIQAQLDWICTFNKTITITQTIHVMEPPKLLISPAVEAYCVPGAFGAGAGAEIDMWFDRWQISGGAGYGVHNVDNTWSQGVYGTVRAKYNLFRWPRK